MAEVRALVDRDPVVDVFVASRLEIAGLDPWRLGAEMWGYGDRGRLTSLCYSGPNLVPVHASEEAIRAFAERAKRQGRRCSSIVGPATEVSYLWQLLKPHWGRPREERLSQPLLAIDREPAGRRGPGRAAGPRRTSWTILLPACIEMFTEEVGVSPMAADGGAMYRARVAELIEQGLAWARIEDGKVLFKAEVGCFTEQGVPGAGCVGAPVPARIRGGYGGNRRDRRSRSRGRCPCRQPVRERLQPSGPTCLREGRLPRGRYLRQHPLLKGFPVTLSLKPGTSWADVYARARAAAPEAFDEDRILNLAGGEWKRIGSPGEHVTPVDGSLIQGPPRIDHDDAVTAVSQAADEHKLWTSVDLDERKSRVAAAVAEMREHRDTLALLLVWEIGKPWRLACADVDRALDGVDWYLGEIERQIEGRTPLPGPVSNIASWNYPMSVQVHAELVQALAGNAVVAKTPSQGGFHTLTLAHAFMKRAGLPVTLLSGVGASAR